VCVLVEYTVSTSCNARCISCNARCIFLDSSYSSAHYHLGLSYASLGDSASSISCYRRAALLVHAASLSALRSLGLLW
jgi:hypothetical protein